MSHRGIAKKIAQLDLKDAEEEGDVSGFIRAKALAKSWDCDVRTIKRMVLRGDIPGFKRGGVLVLKKSDVLKYIEANKVNPRPPTPPIAA